MAGETRKVRLTRSIVLAGDIEEEGTIHEVQAALAHRLVGEGSAVHHYEEGEEPDAAPTTVNRMEHAGERDPHTDQVAPGPKPKVKK
jgi:hypothetical protein